MRRACSALVALAVAASALPVAAQTAEERAGARAAAMQGAQAYMEGRWADTIDLMARAQALVDSPSHLLYIARAEAKLGQLVKARETYLEITRKQLAPDAPEAFRSAQQEADRELRDIEPRLPYVSVVVQGAGPLPVTVTMDGQQVPQALVGVPRPVDPGEHRFQAFAQGMESNATSITVKEGARETVVLTLQPAEGGGAGPAPAGPSNGGNGAGNGGAGAVTQGPDPVADSGGGGGGRGLLIGSAIGGVVGLGGIVAGSVFLGKAGSRQKDADRLFDEHDGASLSPTDPIAREIVDLDDQATSARRNAAIFYGLGAAGIAAGVTLFLLSSGGDEPSQSASIQPWIGLGSAGVSGRF